MPDKKKLFRNTVLTNSPLKIVLVYCVFSLLWILFSDDLMFSIFATLRAHKIISLLKGWFFVIVTSLLLYRLISSAIRKTIDAEEKLLALEKYSRNLFDKSSMGLALTAFDGKFVDVNYAFAEITGRSVEDFLKINSGDIIPKKYSSLEKEIVALLMKNGHYGPIEKEYIHKKGHLVPVRLQGSLIERGGEKFIWSSVENITEQKKSEELLSRTQKFLNEFMNHTPAVVYAADADGKIILTNNQFESVTGSVKEKIIGSTRESFLPPEIAAEHRANDLNVIRSKEAITIEETNIQQDGLHYYISSKFPLTDSKGNVYAVGGISTEITERRKSEEALKLSEEKFHKAFQNSPDAIMISRMSDGVFYEVNENFYKISGYTRNEVIGHSSTEINFWLSPEERNNYVSGLVQNGRVENMEVSFRTKDGSIKDFVLSGEAIDLNGEKYIIGTVRDVTEKKLTDQILKESEEKFRKMVEELPSGIIIINHEGTIIGWNRAQEKITGITSENAIGKTSWDLQLSLMPNSIVTEDLRNYTKKAILELFTEIPKDYLRLPIERKVQRRDGRLVTIESIVFIYKTKTDSIAVTISTDITDRKKIEEDLRKSHSQLRALTSHIEKIIEEERASIAREMHDELGQILTSLKMNIAFIRKEIESGILESKREHMLSELIEINLKIDTAVAQVRRLITQLRPDILDKLGLLAALEWYAEEFSKSSKIKCVLNSEFEELSVNADKDLAIFRIVQEAMTNILKYANAKIVTITLKKEGDVLLVEIKDDGRGISDLEIKGDKSFGLLGMRERAVLIGGTIDIYGESGKGTTVKLRVKL